MKALNIFTLALGLLLALSSPTVYAQSSDKLTADELKQVDFSKPISSTQTADRKYTLVFVDTQKRSIIKTFDIRQNNPFAQMGKKTNDPNYDVYEFEKKMLKDVFPNFNNEHYVNKDKLKETISSVNVGYWLGFSENKQFVAVSYTVASDIGVCRTLIIVFDSKGLEISRFSVDLAIKDIGLTNNGEYTAILYEWQEIDNGYLINGGIKIIKNKGNEVIYDKEIADLTGVSNFNNIIFTGNHPYYSENRTRVIKQWYFDFEKQKVFSKELDVDCFGKAEHVEDGLVMRCINGMSYKLSFSSDFEVEDLR